MAVKDATKKIKELMRNGTPLTSWDAIQMFRYTRLAALICLWRKQGADIDPKGKVNQNGVNYTVYRYISEPKNEYKSDLSKLS